MSEIHRVQVERADSGKIEHYVFWLRIPARRYMFVRELHFMVEVPTLVLERACTVVLAFVVKIKDAWG